MSFIKKSIIFGLLMLKSHFKRNLQFDVTCLSFLKFQFLIITPKGMSLTSEISHCSSCENKARILFFLNLFQQQILSLKKKKKGILHLFYFKPTENKIGQGNLILSSYFFLVILICIEITIFPLRAFMASSKSFTRF